MKNVSVIASLLILTLISFQPVSAERADYAEMEQVCRNWLSLNIFQNGQWAGAVNPSIESSQDIVKDGLVVARYFAIAPDGFIIVPVLKELPPVTASSDNCRLVPDENNGIWALTADLLYNRLSVFIDTYGSIEASQTGRGEALLGYEDRRLWDRYTGSDETFITDLKQGSLTRSEQVGPLLTTAWHQGYPYNMYCPMGDGGRCVVGCVATAAAQILRYWEWPVYGVDDEVYYWDGDNSCEGSTPGQMLSAEFSDQYIWDDQYENLAEINYEVGVAFNMDYGRCGSGIYTSQIPRVMNAYVNFFRYRYGINSVYRTAFVRDDWFAVIQDEINAGRPTQYFITAHSIVCDGWRDLGGEKQYHMNYGWGGSQNAWFAVDFTYCSWSGCSWSTEFMIRNIEPRFHSIEADTVFGSVPLDVSFTGQTDLTVDNWTWHFGDGETVSGNYRTHSHLYETPGVYDITLDISANGDTYSATRSQYVTVVADTMHAGSTEGDLGSTVVIPVEANNTLPVNKITIPIKYAGSLTLSLDSVSTAGCRTDGFVIEKTSLGAGFYRVELESGTSAMEPGQGNVLNIYFTVHSGSADDVAVISLANIGEENYPEFRSTFKEYVYAVDVTDGTVRLPVACGDVNSDNMLNILDVVFLINFLYKDGPAPALPEKADLNDDTLYNILDVVYLINFLYKGGPQPDCP
jgi:PKD repeat protein